MARAYVDQLERGNALSESFVADLAEVLDRSTALLQDGKQDGDMAARLDSLAAALEEGDGNAITTKRRVKLAETLGGIADRLR